MNIPQRVMDELIRAKQSALDAQGAFADTLEAVADRYQASRPALRRYVNAACRDRLGKLQEETESLQMMLFPDGVDTLRQAAVTLKRAAA